MELENKTILITGASAGIGRALAEKLARTKCNLILTARRIQLLEIIKSKNNYSARIEVVKCDSGCKDEVMAAYEYAKKVFGGIDIVILNAGVGSPVKVEEFSSSGAEEAMRTNFLGVVYWVEVLINAFIEKRGGIIVGVSSLADNRAYGATFYNSSKAALSNFLEGLRLDLKKYNVRVLTVKPGFVNTHMTAQNNFTMPFLLSPEEAADKIIRGIEKEKKIIQFPWQTVLLTRIIGLLSLTVFEFFMKKKQ
jgi:short-subunit dehydrogenase